MTSDPTAADRMRRYRARLRGEDVPQKRGGRPPKRASASERRDDYGAGLDLSNLGAELKQILSELDGPRQPGLGLDPYKAGEELKRVLCAISQELKLVLQKLEMPRQQSARLGLNQIGEELRQLLRDLV